MNTASPPFSARLRAASWPEHQGAESQRYISALVAGDLDLDGYARLVVQHHAIYQALESVAETMRTDPVAGDFVDDALTRLPALVADLEFLLGPDWRQRIEPDPETTAYVERIRRVGGSPAGFVAHHYTRYLGDLSGGLYIGRAVAKRYGLTDGDGVAFYRFDGIADPKAYKNAYRAKLDAIDLTEAELAGLVDEVLVAYRHNVEVFTGLSRHVPAGLPTDREEAA
jgi:heme oxygenase (biliverdin-producing, ferredoxin)